jgi:hypothetical protein
MNNKIYYIDVDGTMTDAPLSIWGNPDMKMIEKVKQLCLTNFVVVWSAGGQKYAKDFCEAYNIEPAFILPKPDIMVDDCPTIRHNNHIKLITPKEFKKGDL